jgi:hypothetical protein
MAKTSVKKVPAEVEERPRRKRSIQLQSYLARWIPYWGHPGWLNAERWRAFVRNQPSAQVCRNTLIFNILSMGWDIQAKDPEDSEKRNIKKAIEYYRDLFEKIEGEFDAFIELMGQDLLDLPFGAMCEVVREDDDPEGHVISIHHVDAATLFPTGDDDFPVQQRVPDLPGAIVNFPAHSIERMMMTPRPEIRRKGWGMAPPEIAYLAVEMLYRGDRYYANLMLDTPEAGLLDLGDLDEKSATEWIEGVRSLFSGIDPFKVPILWGSRERSPQWIPFNLPPNEMIYDKVTLKYLQILCAAYGMRLSDIGMSELSGEKTLAGVIRGERQTRRSGFALIRSKLENLFNRILPAYLKFVWIDDDEETKLARAKTLMAYGQSLSSMTGGKKILSQEEARREIVAQGLLETDIDPDEVPEDEMMQQGIVQGGEEQPAFPFGRPKSQGGEEEKVPPSQGGRGLLPSIQRRLMIRQNPQFAEEQQAQWTSEDLLEMMNQIIAPNMALIPDRAEAPRLRRLIKVATRAMVPSIQKSFQNLTDSQIQRYWLPEMQAVDFELPSELSTYVTRQSAEEIREELESHLEDDPWWRTASALDKARILEIYVAAYETGMQDMALDVVRALYEEGMRSRPDLIGINFELVNERTISELETRAADLVAWVDQGTKTFIKRVVVAGVRQGLASPKIAQAIREGETAEIILRDDEFMGDVTKLIQDGLIEMSEARSISIVNTEINRAENQGKWGQMLRSGFTTKRWVHLGERGITEAGNVHPCPVCAANEELEWVPIDFAFRTVFKKGGVDGKGGEQTPPAHPNVCHCTIYFPEKELFQLVESGEYIPWTGQ